MANSIYDFTLQTIDGKEQSLAEYQGKTLVLVNVASKCGLTPQYADIQQFYDEYKDKDVVVLGFPANNFGGQEPGTNQEIKQFCSHNYGIEFPMFAKISVNGEDQHPLYQFLTQQTGEEVSWNFQKFVVDKSGNNIKAFSPQISVKEASFQSYLQEIL